MSQRPRTCDVCGTLITGPRGGELVRKGDDFVWVHPRCRGKRIVVYVPQGSARFAYFALEDPVQPDGDGWERLKDVESQRGRWGATDATDVLAGLQELVNEGWAEANDNGDAFRLTATGASLRPRLDA